MRKFRLENLASRAKVRTSELREQQEQRKTAGPLMIQTKKYPLGIRPAELILTNPGYFYWWLEKFTHYGAVGMQAWEVAQKARHILPPRATPSKYRFDLRFDGSGRLKSYEVVLGSKPLSSRPNILRVKHLDMSLLSTAGPNSNIACNGILECIETEFLPDKKLKYWDYQEFFDDPGNFDNKCRELHCPKIIRLGATS